MITCAARILSGEDIGHLIFDSKGVGWRIVEVHHYPSGVTIDVHHRDVENWATSEPSDEVEYKFDDMVTVWAQT